jgi:hypothetical protein
MRKLLMWPLMMILILPLELDGVVPNAVHVCHDLCLKKGLCLKRQFSAGNMADHQLPIISKSQWTRTKSQQLLLQSCTLSNLEAQLRAEQEWRFRIAHNLDLVDNHPDNPVVPSGSGNCVWKYNS